MKEKIIKIMSILERFSIGDLSTYLECDANEIVPYVDQLEKEEIINKIANNEYLLDKSKISKFKKRTKNLKLDTKDSNTEKKLFDLDNYKNFPAKKVFTKKRDLDFYNNCDDKTKKLIIKNVVLFNLIGNLTKEEVKTYIDRIAQEYPEYKMNAQWYKTKYKRYLEEGLPGLYRNKLYSIENKGYEDFKKIYLSPKQYTKEQAYEILKMKGYKSDSLLSLSTFMCRLNREFSKEAIEKCRTLITKDCESQENLTHKKQKQPYNILFKNAAYRYWKMIKENTDDRRNIISKKRDITRLKEHFGDCKIRSITQEKIVEFKQNLISEGICLSTIKILIGSLLTMLRLCGYRVNYDIHENLTNSAAIYSLEKIKKLIEKDGPEVWVISLGLRLAELQAVEYEDIDHNRGILMIGKCYRENMIVYFRQRQNQKRELKMPQYLLNKIDKNKTGLIFGQINMPNYESCLYAHIMLLHSQNVSMNIIAKGMGYTSLHNFYRQFHHLFPQKLENDFDVLKPLGFD